MTRWAAMLRGVNLGGRKLLMTDLARVCAALGFGEVRTLRLRQQIVADRVQAGGRPGGQIATCAQTVVQTARGGAWIELGQRDRIGGVDAIAARIYPVVVVDVLVTELQLGERTPFQVARRIPLEVFLFIGALLVVDAAGLHCAGVLRTGRQSCRRTRQRPIGGAAVVVVHCGVLTVEGIVVAAVRHQELHQVFGVLAAGGLGATPSPKVAEVTTPFCTLALVTFCRSLLHAGQT
ncbi:MAG: DUF1697 domain-containing protein [Oxalobacteraceae bacterium]|nr:MAG: DUF1697 domain-containing protein [Oxalobacteraceae bacterium]